MTCQNSHPFSHYLWFELEINKPHFEYTCELIASKSQFGLDDTKASKNENLKKYSLFAI